MVALKQSATHLRRILMHVKGMPEQHKHMDPFQLCCIQQRVQIAGQEATKQNLDVETVPNIPKPWASSLRGERVTILMPHRASTMI